MVDQQQIAADLQAQVVLVDAAIEAATTAAGTLQQATLAEVAPAIDATLTALVVFADAVSQLDGDIDETNAGGVVVGIPAPLMIDALTTQESEVNQLAVVLDAQAYLARTSVNLEQVTG